MNNIKVAFLIFLFIANSLSPVCAGEGMWLPIFLKALNESEMQSMGMRISTEDIYSVNQGSLKDAIGHFGGFCTSEVISSQGLLLTNHHCGYGQIQSHSSIDNNILQNGFWAKNINEEKPNPGLYVTFIQSIEDVTNKVLKGILVDMSESDRSSIVDRNIQEITEKYDLKKFESVQVKSFYNGNQYFVFKTITYHDIRLVGTPPEMIGKFGADTDNWIFPRHTGDFALFRIYANKENEPAEYSEDNVPYRPKHFLPISLKGVEEGDFTMIFGFPGRTNQYLPSIAIEHIVQKLNPAKIEIRDKALKVMDKYMRQDPSIKIKYSSKFASIANYWKKWIGESQGLTSSKAIDKKKKYETNFQNNAKKKYKSLLSELDYVYRQMGKYTFARDVYSEVATRNIEVLRVMAILRRLIKTYNNNGQEGYNKFNERLIPYLENLYKNYEPMIDQEVMVQLLDTYTKMVGKDLLPDALKGNKSIEEVTNSLFNESMMDNGMEVLGLLKSEPKIAIEQFKKDELYNLAEEWHNIYSDYVKPLDKLKVKRDSLQRIYMQAQMETFPNKRFWPDANSTMRITYGNVMGYRPRDGVRYDYTTYIDGILEKHVDGDYEFDVPDKMIELIENRDFGQYTDATGMVPICFIGTNHTTGGNSGSPAIDADGNLVGLNFDRVWEGTMSDLNYDESICRNIMVDMRYILWVVDKYANAKHLIEEMKLVP